MATEQLYDGPMIHAEALPGAEVLAIVTLPFAPPEVSNCINTHFAQIWENPPAIAPGTDPGIVVHSFGRGKTVWVAAAIESKDWDVNAKLVLHLLNECCRDRTGLN